MHRVFKSGKLHYGTAAAVLLPALLACIGASSRAAAATPTYTTNLFAQPWESGISGNFFVPPATNSPVPKGKFGLVLWQPDRFTSDGLLVPVGWGAGSKSGFTPSNPLIAQLGFQSKSGTSTAQMEGNEVGAYINSQDLPPSTTDQKMMITPEFTFALGSQPMPFASANTALHGSMDLQVPTAVGSAAYVVLDMVFQTTSGVKISYGVAIFHNGAAPSAVTTGYDSPSNEYMLNSPLGVDQRFVARASDSAGPTGTPWSGWRHFDWSISEAQFANALKYLTSTYPGKVTSADPTQYMLTNVHLNAEFHTKGKPAQLGWSMRGLTLWTTQ